MMTDQEAINTYLHSADYYEEDTPALHCSNCEDHIWEGDEYYLIGTEKLCKKCLDMYYMYTA